MSNASFGLKQALTQRTTLTLSQRQSVELLQLTGPELQAQIGTILAANPLIESTETNGFEADAAEPIVSEALACDEPAGVAHDFKEPTFLTWAKSPLEEDDLDPYAKVSSEENLTDFLMQEISELHLDGQMRQLLEWLVGNLDENGFLIDSLEDCAKAYPLSVNIQMWQQALNLLQSLDPAGIGAKNAIDSLIIQLNRTVDENNIACTQRAVQLLVDAKDLILKRDFKTAAQKFKCTQAQIFEAYSLICKLNPHPASAFGDSSENRYVIPEVIVQKTAQGLKVTLNPAVIPHLRFDVESFELITKAKLSGEEKSLWKQKADEAKNFVHSIEQRFSTIAAVAQTIVDLQPDFFVAGAPALKPMGLKDIAARLAMAESTISRATAGKYMQTPLGTFEFKAFFTSSVAGADGASVSSTVVRRRIAEIIAAEDPKKPLSDNSIAEILAKDGIEIARRTVAKYRELEHIAPKALRKALV